jgi:hypothetical protein
VFFQTTGFLSMKMGCGIVQCSQPTAVRASGGNFGYVREKGFKTENIVDYTSAEEDGFLEGTGSLLDRANEKHIALCLLALMKNCLLSSVKILIMHQYYLRLFTR